ncbi:hypothetical protein HIM_04814 [Hirsutella minnesotensis 3608]|uniref:Glutaminase A n=1 Tax=Hirsutella minnesotensis 3608 TaxID=1043627 RepID=A0A0F8A0W5_9HYPO|nr:hypothetical protein HIM_04814 [Hirsutella minnesotensis 3608]
MVPITFFMAVAIAAPAVASSLKPPVLPLCVRSPYLSTWLANARDPPWEHWPMFWTGQKTGLSVMASVANTKTVYPLLGRPHDSLQHAQGVEISFPAYDGASFDASTTNLTFKLGPNMSSKIILSFVSPITPTSTVRQSIPACYMAIHLEGASNINIYADINGEWVTGVDSSIVKWELLETERNEAQDRPSIKSWSLSRVNQLLFTESSDKAEWGVLHFSAPSSARHQAGASADLRLRFAQRGCLEDVIDNQFRSITDREPVLAYSVSFNSSAENTKMSDGDHVTTKHTVVFTMALLQNPVVQYAAARGLTYMRPLWASYFPKPQDMLTWHYADFDKASLLMQAYSSQLNDDATGSISREYSDIVALSARQVLGATQFSGTPENPLLFLKEISSNGNFQTVDVIFPAFPFFLYTNPRWLVYLLEPLLEHQLSGQYPNNYSMHDLGAHYPNATGHADGNDEYMPVEECGNMLIMALAVANSVRDSSHPAWNSRTTSDQGFSISGLWELVHRSYEGGHAKGTLPPLEVDVLGIDRSPIAAGAASQEMARTWVSRSYTLLKKWTGYLVRESLIPRNQLSTDDFAGWLANHTNLALKGIIGIRAMAEVSELVDEQDDAHDYRQISSSYISKWLDFAISRDGTHAKLAYTWYGSWTTLYNLFANSLLCFNRAESPDTVRVVTSQKSLGTLVGEPFIPRRVYSMQSQWYSSVLQRYGLPLDSRHLYTKSDWQFFAAAVAGKKTREGITESIALWVNETITDRPLTDLYDTEGEGGYSPATFMARPVVGGHFARLALERACGGTAVDWLNFLDVHDEEARM